MTIPTIDNFDKLTYDEREKVTLNMPKRVKVRMYLKYCTEDEILNLINEWDKTNNEKMLTAMRKAMKKHKKYKHLFK